MSSNPALRRLGYDDDDRVVIIHTDDIGVAEATVSAHGELAEFGIISSAATMVPCSWFPMVASYCREHPEVDMGVHLTITSEHDHMRWGPISSRDPATGMVDDEGYFHRTSQAAQENGDPQAVQRELREQVARALSAGIDVSHVDTHMVAVGHLKFASAYIQTAFQNGLPLMMLRYDERAWLAMGISREMARQAVLFGQQLEAQGLPLLDNMVSLPLDDPIDRVGQAKAALAALPPGITHFIIHPSRDTPEIRSAAVSSWPSRVADFEAFRSDELRKFVKNSGVQIIGYRHLRELVRSV